MGFAPFGRFIGSAESFLVFRTLKLVKAQHFWGRSLRLLYGGGRSALYGGAPVGRFMGCAESFQLLTPHSSLLTKLKVFRFNPTSWAFAPPCKR